MTEITQVAYQDLRDYIESNWKYIALKAVGEVLVGYDNLDRPVYEEGEVEIVRLSTDDSRVTWVHEPNSAELQLQIVLKGSDAEITLPATINGSSIYKSESDGEAYSSESFNDFTFESENDELTVIHSIQVPQSI